MGLLSGLRGVPVPLLLAAGVVGLTLSGLLFGYEPVGADADLMYRPIKSELARALGAGTLPLWSDRFGAGTPLAAESHAAAFYPPNWLIYRVLAVPTAYRLAMWSHLLALVFSTYFYGRTLGLTMEGGGLAAMAFALCGFVSSHSVHEPFYHALPFVPLSLGMAEGYLRVGGFSWIAGLALVLGLQMTLGHFQIQAWTSGLIILTAFWGVYARGVPRWRGLALCGAIAWGVAVAGVQLALTWELVRVLKFERDTRMLSDFSLPPAHWAQPGLPRLFMGFRDGMESPYWRNELSSPQEACFYIGTIPIVLAAVGYLARRDPTLGLWKRLIPIAFALATMPRWWDQGYAMFLFFPVLGTFRAPARYTLIATLGLCVLAGGGLDRLVPARRFWLGFAGAILFGGAAMAFGWAWAARPEIVSLLGVGSRIRLMGEAAGFWLIATVMVVAWRRGLAPSYVLMLLSALELAYLYHHGTTRWRKGYRLPDESPVLSRLARERDVGLVAGGVMNIPVRLGLATAEPYLGIIPPPPNYLLRSVNHPNQADIDYVIWRRRFGVTHGVFDQTARLRVVADREERVGRDEVLETLLPRDVQGRGPRLWRIEHYHDAVPRVRAAVRTRVVDNWYQLFALLSRDIKPDEVCFVREDAPADPPGPRARSARVVRWSGESGEVEHDGTCDLVVRRTYFPGWSARLDGHTEVPALKADGDFQAFRLPGAGVTKVELRYRPTLIAWGLGSSLAGVGLALTVLTGATLRRVRTRSWS